MKKEEDSGRKEKRVHLQPRWVSRSFYVVHTSILGKLPLHSICLWKEDSVTTGILQIRWTDDGDRDVAALAIMYIAEVPNESSVS